MRTFALSVLFFAGFAVFATAFLHGILGGGAMLAELEAGGISADVRGAIAISTAAGSLCWAMLGVIVLLAGVRLRRGDGSLWLPAFAIGVLWIGFGLVALVVRGFRPHFLVFIVMGGLLVGSLLPLREPDSPMD